MHNIENPILFKENCLTIGYTLVALMTDYLFDLYKVELERIEGHKISKSVDIARVKQGMFEDLMPISDTYVKYEDFKVASKRSEWSGMISKMRVMIMKTIETIKAHRHLTD